MFLYSTKKSFFLENNIAKNAQQMKANENLLIICLFLFDLQILCWKFFQDLEYKQAGRNWLVNEKVSAISGIFLSFFFDRSDSFLFSCALHVRRTYEKKKRVNWNNFFPSIIFSQKDKRRQRTESLIYQIKLGWSKKNKANFFFWSLWITELLGSHKQLNINLKPRRDLLRQTLKQINFDQSEYFENFGKEKSVNQQQEQKKMNGAGRSFGKMLNLALNASGRVVKSNGTVVSQTLSDDEGRESESNPWDFETTAAMKKRKNESSGSSSGSNNSSGSSGSSNNSSTSSHVGKSSEQDWQKDNRLTDPSSPSILNLNEDRYSPSPMSLSAKSARNSYNHHGSDSGRRRKKVFQEVKSVNRSSISSASASSPSRVNHSGLVNLYGHIPEHFICPITQDLMRNPVTIDSGHTFERQAITDWFNQGQAINPVTGEELSDTQIRHGLFFLFFSINLFIPNFALADAIRDWKDRLAEELFRISTDGVLCYKNGLLTFDEKVAVNQRQQQQQPQPQPQLQPQSQQSVANEMERKVYKTPIIAFMGPNKIGKSTLLNLIAETSVFITLDDIPSETGQTKVVRMKYIQRPDRSFLLLDVEGLFPNWLIFFFFSVAFPMHVVFSKFLLLSFFLKKALTFFFKKKRGSLSKLGHIIRFFFTKKKVRTQRCMRVYGGKKKRNNKEEKDSKELAQTEELVSESVMKIFLAVYCISSVIVWNDTNENNPILKSLLQKADAMISDMNSQVCSPSGDLRHVRILSQCDQSAIPSNVQQFLKNKTAELQDYLHKQAKSKLTHKPAFIILKRDFTESADLIHPEVHPPPLITFV
ncbi:hypothetical protein RFI_05574 [Reticulomyxa filosa]|uniref:U-box domain-containing protein n=1 Tax=Reticulomyxa filosa TaxID=46433 RepID=X6P0E2_RETFI|nr:hypothetical protein RFI_05574 [Reticulomyxa filosa]|eukprot:ETO31544.1 hypothetical protein RFI_05574 [Reticulomyxa filosa]